LGSDDLAGWRQRRLRRAGFPRTLAQGLGGDCRIDLHALLTLVERGCPPELAARIVAPLDDEGAPC
jgi:hypothetical protein